MKIARYLAHGQISYGAVENDSVKELSASPFEEFTITDHTHKISDVQLLAPCEPTKILAIGLNYSSHLHDRHAPAEPMVFYKIIEKLTFGFEYTSQKNRENRKCLEFKDK